MATVEFTLDGVKVQAEEGQTLLQTARDNGADIPSLCHDPRLNPFGACRLCLVEVEGARGPVPACAATISRGMVVKTNTEKIIKIRRMGLELLLSNHYGDCESPCKGACPAGIDIQGFIAHIANGHYSIAAGLIKESLPLPAVVGRVCPRFCEEKCRRNIVDQPVAICNLKRFVGDYDLDNYNPPPVKPASGYRIAVVGGGPGGLSAAYYLAMEGHRVTIFESSDKLGGMLRYGIPEYRLPKELLDREIATITGLCEDIRYGCSLGPDFTLESLKQEGFEAVFLALGAQLGQRMKLPGEDSEGVLTGIDFLRRVVQGENLSLGHRVAVVGGGNTAIDVARTAVRLGAGEVSVLYRRSEQEMPANQEEVREAREEGVIFRFLINPTRVMAEEGKLTAVECVEMALGEPDQSGRRRPEPLAGSEFLLKVNSLICATGQSIDAASLKQEPGLTLGAGNRIQVQPAIMATSLPGVFAGGDCVTGPATVVETIAAGKKAAYAINCFVRGESMAMPQEPYNHSRGELADIDPEEYTEKRKIPVTPPITVHPRERKNNFREVVEGYTEDMALREAERCLSCGCLDAFDCKLRNLSTEYEVNTSRFKTGVYKYPISNNHQHIIRDANKCILCGSCARICQEVQGVSALSFAGRGFETVIQPPLNIPLNETLCESCGQCVSTCPTGALTVKPYLSKPGPWRTKSIPTTCPHCSIGCNIELKVIGQTIVGVTSRVIGTINDGNLCKKGAFDYQFITSADRIKTPLIKKDGRLVAVTWEEAISAAASGLGRIREFLGPTALAVLVSPKMSCEENYLAQKMARMALGTGNIDSLYNGTNRFIDESLPGNKIPFASIDSADLLALVHSDPAVEYAVIANRIRKAIHGGSKLITFNHRATRMDPDAEATITINPGEMELLLKGMLEYLLRYELLDENGIDPELLEDIKNCPLHEIGEQLRTGPIKVLKTLHLFIKARNPVIIVDTQKTSAKELRLLNLLGKIKNSTEKGDNVIALHPYGNGFGQLEAGVNPSYLPGFMPVNNTAARQELLKLWHQPLPEQGAPNIHEQLQQGHIVGALILTNHEVNLDNLIKEHTFTVVVTSNLNHKLSWANIILPAATFAETTGTMLNSEGRVQRLRQALKPLAGKENMEIVTLLSTALGYPMEYKNYREIRTELEQILSRNSGILQLG